MKSWVYTHETHARIYVIQQRKAFECQTNRPTPMPPAEHWAMHTQDRKSLSSEYHCKDSKKKKKMNCYCNHSPKKTVWNCDMNTTQLTSWYSKNINILHRIYTGPRVLGHNVQDIIQHYSIYKEPEQYILA